MKKDCHGYKYPLTTHWNLGREEGAFGKCLIMKVFPLSAYKLMIFPTL
jgi:hypothetical protein